MLRKPVMSTPDLRLFDADPPALLPDGSPRRGISVVAALSLRLDHLNRRAEGAWTQRYERGVPVTDLVAVDHDGTTGTTVRLLPDPRLAPLPAAGSPAWQPVHAWPDLAVDVVRPGTVGV